jgi:hypothetical protein
MTSRGHHEKAYHGTAPVMIAGSWPEHDIGDAPQRKEITAKVPRKGCKREKADQNGRYSPGDHLTKTSIATGGRLDIRIK